MMIKTFPFVFRGRTYTDHGELGSYIKPPRYLEVLISVTKLIEQFGRQHLFAVDVTPKFGIEVESVLHIRDTTSSPSQEKRDFRKISIDAYLTN